MPSRHPLVEKYRADLQFDAHVQGESFQFIATHGLFSPKAVDEGSDLLLRELLHNEGELAPDADSLDVGCGYGVLGMTLARKAPQGRHLLLDKDFVAVDYAARNLERNGIRNAETLLSNGFSNVPDDRRFDVIVSNLPAKVGNEMFYLYFYDALHHLKPDGRFYVVTINGLRDFIKRSFNEVFGNYEKCKQGKTYTVSMAKKSA